MEELLTQLLGKKIALSCGTSTVVRGEVLKVESGVLHMKDKDDKIAFVSMEKICVVWEVSENEGRAGFISNK